jgi:hypothetical protein
MPDFKYVVFTRKGTRQAESSTVKEATAEAKRIGGFVIDLTSPYNPLKYCSPEAIADTRKFCWVALNKNRVFGFATDRSDLSKTANAYVTNLYPSINPSKKMKDSKGNNFTVTLNPHEEYFDDEGFLYNAQGARSNPYHETRARNPGSRRKNPSTTSDFKRGFKDGLQGVLTANKFYNKAGKKKNPSASDSDEYVAGYVTAVRMFAPDLIPSRQASWRAINAIVDGLGTDIPPPVTPPVTPPTRPAVVKPPEVIVPSTGIKEDAERLYNLIPDGGYVKYEEARKTLGLTRDRMKLAKADLMNRHMVHTEPGARGLYLKLYKGSGNKVSVQEAFPQVEFPSHTLEHAKGMILNALPADGSVLGGGTLIRETGLDKRIASKAVSALQEEGKVRKVVGKGFALITSPIAVVVGDVPEDDEDIPLGSINQKAWQDFTAQAALAKVSFEEMAEKYAEALVLAMEGDPVIGMIAKEEGSPGVILIGPAEEGLSPDQMVEMIMGKDGIPGMSYAAVLTDSMKKNPALTTSQRSRLPDSAFLYISPSGERKLPVYGPNGRLSIGHIRSAMGRLSQTHMPAHLKPALKKKIARLYEQAKRDR